MWTCSLVPNSSLQSNHWVRKVCPGCMITFAYSPKCIFKVLINCSPVSSKHWSLSHGAVVWYIFLVTIPHRDTSYYIIHKLISSHGPEVMIFVNPMISQYNDVTKEVIKIIDKWFTKYNHRVLEIEMTKIRVIYAFKLNIGEHYFYRSKVSFSYLRIMKSYWAYIYSKYTSNLVLSGVFKIQVAK